MCRYKAAVIGLGVMGRNHYRLLREHPDVEVAALCDPEPDREYPEEIFSGVREMIEERKDIDFAVVSVPTPLHSAVTDICINAGIDLLIEKPVASDSVQGREMLERIRESGIKSAVGHVERFNPVVNALKQEIKERSIQNINFTRIGPLPPRIIDVGVLTDLAVHDIDLVRYISEREIVDKNIYSAQMIEGHFEDSALISFSLGDGILAGIVTNWLTPFKKRRIDLVSETSYYEADLITQDLKEYSSYRDNDNVFLTKNCFVKKGEPLKSELDAFINYINTGERGRLASVEDSIYTLEIIEEFRD